MQGEQLNESELRDAVLALLRSRLPASWSVDRVALAGDTEPRDLLIKSPLGNAQSTILVEPRLTVTPRDVQAMMGGPWRRMRRQTGNQPMLLIAPYIGPKVRGLLKEEGVSFLDLTGNTWISLDSPGIFIEWPGAQRNPNSTKPRRGLGGAKAGAIVRVLVDAAPPYRGSEIARAAKVNEGYASRVLETLRDEGLIDRDGFGPVMDVDWPALIRRRAQTVDLLRGTGVFTYIARRGNRALLGRLAEQQVDPRATITGSFATVRLAPVAAPALLVVYTMRPRELAEDFDLLPADSGADTVLIRPENDVVFARSSVEDGVRWAAPGQVAIDCLSGNGRMPAEGDALIEWMKKNESSWRAPAIKQLGSSDQAR